MVELLGGVDGLGCRDSPVDMRLCKETLMGNRPSHRTCLLQVYCSGELLAAVQMSALFEDSKEFVDMPMRMDPEAILQVGRQGVLPPT